MSTELALHQDHIGWSMKSLSRGVKKGTKAVVKSPVLKVGVGVAAFVYPPVGVPAAAALTAANKVLSAAQSGTAAVKAAAQRTIANTIKLAKQDTGARRGLQVLQAAKAARKPVARKPVARKPVARKPVARKPAAKIPVAAVKQLGAIMSGSLVLPSGKIVRGKWRAV